MTLPAWPTNRLAHFDQKVWHVPRVAPTSSPGYFALVDGPHEGTPLVWVLLPIRVDPAIDVRMWTWSWVPQVAW